MNKTDNSIPELMKLFNIRNYVNGDSKVWHTSNREGDFFGNIVAQIFEFFHTREVNHES